MGRFRERVGTVRPRSVIQIEELDVETRVSLWNVLHRVFEASDLVGGFAEYGEQVSKWIWTEVLHRTADNYSSRGAVRSLLKERVLKGDWDVALESIEEALKWTDQETGLRSHDLARRGREAVDHVFEKCLVGYRFIDSQITPIDNTLDVEAVKEAVADAADFTGAQHHLERAIDLLSDRQNPDFANSIKESISAVESVVKRVTGQGTLGAGLKALKTQGVNIHPALEIAWSKTYGWTSDADGIRHALDEPAQVSPELAKYMLVACSAFVSYVIGSARSTNLLAP